MFNYLLFNYIFNKRNPFKLKNGDEEVLTYTDKTYSDLFSNQKIEELEKITTGTKIDTDTRASMVEAKKGLLESKQYLKTILITLKQATKAKAIIQTGGGSTGGSDVGAGGQTDGNNPGDADSGNQPRK